ncbi:MAG TPA: (d)CMP kinase [Thermodesulfobacteriota bacterium]|nr:(d)CMP kinase [Thermodesulfobacteriota bacterium]
MIITIDGPSGVGKSTVSKSVARKLGFTYLDTGAMYRAVALQVKRQSVDPGDDKRLKSLLDNTEIRFVRNNNGDPVILLNNEDVTGLIRTPEVSRLSSDVATKRAVRVKLVELQQEIGKDGNIVAEGRDMGTYVFPDAAFKFYLDASLDERARRRWKQLAEAGGGGDIESVKNEIIKRDSQDMERSESPLHPAVNAVIIDTTDLTSDEVTDRIIKEIQG